MTSAREAVENGYKSVAEAFHTGDADAISRMYTAEAELFFPGTPIIEGRRAIHEAWKSIVGSGGNTLSVDVREVQESGDWAYDTGRFTASAPDGSILNAGKWIVIWKRQSSGEWKIHRDFMHWDVPPAPAPAP
jgi:ketosteroid isomerase-like protein